MKRLLLFVFLLFACLLPISSHADIDLSQHGSWPYAAVDTLRNAGVGFSYPDSTSRDLVPHTRFGFAVALARVFATIEPHADQPTDRAFLRDNLSKPLHASPLAVNALIALVTEFSPELIRLRQDVPKAQTYLQTMQKQQRQDINTGKVVLTPEQLKNPFADVSQTDPVRHAQDTLQKSGVVLGYPDGTWSGFPPETRLQMGNDVAHRFSDIGKSQDLVDRLQRNPQDFPALGFLVNDFAPELKLLGQNADTYLTRLAFLVRGGPHLAGSQPFADIPANHQAYQDISTLGESGIFRPDPIEQASANLLSGRRPLSRQKFIVDLSLFLSQMYDTQAHLRPDIQARLLTSPSALSALQDLARQFQPELIALNGDADNLQAQLAELNHTVPHPLAAKPFPDVPANHWAGLAVDTLRRQSLIVGYPQGTFTLSN